MRPPRRPGKMRSLAHEVENGKSAPEESTLPPAHSSVSARPPQRPAQRARVPRQIDSLDIQAHLFPGSDQKEENPTRAVSESQTRPSARVEDAEVVAGGLEKLPTFVRDFARWVRERRNEESEESRSTLTYESQEHLTEPASPHQETSVRQTHLPSQRAEEVIEGRARTATSVSALFESWRSRHSGDDEVSERRRERRTERRKIWAKRVSTISAFAVMLALVAWVIFLSPLFALRSERISVSGVDSSALGSETVREVLAPREGVSLLRLSTGDVASELTSALPLIKNAQVKRSFMHGLEIELTLRVPVACLMTSGECEPVDAEGVTLGIDAQELPHLEIPQGKDLSGEEVTAMLHVLGALDADTRVLVGSVEVDANMQVRLNLTSGAKVLWGDASSLEAKARVLAVLLSQEAAYYDVSVPNHPVTQ